MTDINIKKPDSKTEDLVTKASRFGAFGWLAFFITLAILIIQNIIYALSPAPMYATSDGKVVGQVMFDEAYIRSSDDIQIDLQTFVQHCTSVSKINIWNDLAICNNHMDEALAEFYYNQYKENKYPAKIEKLGCERTSIEFNDDTVIERDEANKIIVNAVMSGNIICNDGKKPKSQAFKSKIRAMLTLRNENKPLGIEVSEYEDF